MSTRSLLARSFAVSGGATPVLESFALTTTGGATPTSLVCTEPSGINDDDILLMHVVIDGDLAHNPTSSGFTLIATDIGGTQVRGYWFWKRASSESGTYTVNWTFTEVCAVHIMRISGCTTTGNPYDVIGATTNNGVITTAIWAELTSTVSNTLIISAASIDRNRLIGVDDAIASVGTGWTLISSGRTDAGGGAVSWIIFEKDLATIGLSGALESTTPTWVSIANCGTRMINFKS